MDRFAVNYACPGCGTTNSLHEHECRFDGTDWYEIEKTYIDVLGVLTTMPRSEETLKERIEVWDALHEGVLERLKRTQRVQAGYRSTRHPNEPPFEPVVESDTGGENGDERVEKLVLLDPEEWREQLVPTSDPIAAVWEYGPVDGAKDNAVTSVVSWHEMMEFSWAETRERTVEWLRETGGWSRGSWEERSPEEVVDGKRHVYEEGYGWMQSASAAASAIEGAKR